MSQETRKYGLFEKQGKQWVRLYPDLAFKKTTAVKMFQSALLAPCYRSVRCSVDKLDGSACNIVVYKKRLMIDPFHHLYENI